MATQHRSRTSQDSFLDVLHTERLAGTENLSAWINHLTAQKGTETLFELELWLKGLRAIFDVKHLPLSEAERSDLVTRSFAPELRIVRETALLCERLTNDIIRLGQPASEEFEPVFENQMRRDAVLDYQAGKIFEQATPLDSLTRLLEALNDVRVLLDTFDGPEEPTYRIFLSLGRSFQRDLKDCRYIEMLLGQRFKRQVDRIDNTVLARLLRQIPERQVRRDVAIAILHFYRFLRCLKLVARDISRDRPLRCYLLVFSLLHKEMEQVSKFLKSRFLEGQGSPALSSASELILYSLKVQSEQAFHRELVFVSREREASVIYAKIEASHQTLRNCYQSCIVTLVQAFAGNFDEKAIFPLMAVGLQKAQQLRRDLWDLRQYMKDVIEHEKAFDLDTIMDRLTTFRESSLRHLLYRDWGEFEHYCDAIITTGNRVETRALLRKFVSFLETVVEEVSKPSVVQDAVSDTAERVND